MNSLPKIFRNIVRQRLNSSIIIISLSIGLACVSLIGVFINRELSTDNFQVNKELIYILSCDDPFVESGRMYSCRYGSAEYMKNNFNQIEDFCRVSNAGSPLSIIAKNEKYDQELSVIAASKNFFEFFSYKLITNNPKTALETDKNIVISEELAIKYFGSADAVGMPITLIGYNKTDTVFVTGVFRKPIEKSQITFDMVRLIGERDSRCYVRILPKTNPHELEEIFKTQKEKIPVIHGGTSGQYYLESLSNAYFDTKRQQPFEISRDKVDLWVALLIGLIIIVIASFNYLGLVNNNLFCKTKEFSVRRINGGTISDLVSIFMIENILLVVISFLISGYLIALGTPYFNLFTGADITLGYVLQAKQIITLISIVLTLLLLTLAFSWLQIRFDLKKSKIKPLGFKFGRRIQLPVFNVIQLAGAIALTICSIVILKQMSYISQKPIGLNKQVIEVKIPSPFASKASAFKDELEKSPSIESVSIASASPLLEHIIILLNYKENGVEKQYTTAVFLGDEKYSSTLGIQLIEGEGFSGNPQLDKDRCLINETLAKTFPDQNLIGRELPGIERFIVAGVVKDFHYNNLKKIVEPGFISFDTRGHHIMVKPKDNQTQQARNAINEIWSRFITDYPPNTESIGERYEWLHRENNNFIRIIGICCLVSLFLSMIGLFAIAFQISKHRTKEIGIRKVNGAKIWEVMLMLNIDFVKWVAIAFVIATPIAYYAMDKWLQNFAYRTQLSWWVFALAGLLALAIALLTVSWQSWRAARRNPVEALRYE